MKKVGIITFHRAHNYGAMLQAYALTKVLKNSNCYIVDYYNGHIYDQYKIIKKIGSKSIRGFVKTFIFNFLFFYKNTKRYISFDKFIKNKYNLTSAVSNNDELKRVTKDFDVLITGSDQVWNPSIVGELSDIYTLNINLPIKKISYAASIGDTSQIDKYKENFQKKLSKIDYISVREEDANKKLTSIINKNVETVLDPTFLLSKEEWEKEIDNIKSTKQKYILAYVVEKNNEYMKIVNYLSEKTGLKVIYFDNRNIGYKNPMKSAFTSGPLEFVSYVKNAEYVVATSFHATAFSIIFNKKFFIIPHKITGSRVTNILEKLNIEGRIYHNLNEFKDIDYDSEIDWKRVNKKLSEERKKSIDWLRNAIEK